MSQDAPKSRLSEADIQTLLQEAGARPTPDARRKADLWQRIENGAATPRRADRRPWLLAAAAVLLATSLALWTTVESGRPVAHAVTDVGSLILRRSQEDGSIVAGTALNAGVTISSGNEGGVLDLTSGSRLRISPNTTLRIEDAVTLHLDSGAIYLEPVSSGTPRVAARIATPLASFTDVGTLFEVRHEPGRSTVRVREGIVEARWSSGLDTVVALESLTLSDTGEVSRSRVDPLGPSWAWVDELRQEFVLEGKTVDEYLQWFARETGVRVRAEDRLRKEVVLGSLHGVAPRDSLLAIAASLGVEVQESDEGLELVPLEP